MPASRLVQYILGLNTEWGPHQENTARLLEAISYQLEWGWADRTTDPDSDEAKAARAEARKQKPPPHPIIPPVAFRPKAQADERAREYMAAIERYLPAPESAEPVDPFVLLAKWKTQHGYS